MTITKETFTTEKRDIPAGAIMTRKAAALLPMITVERTRVSFDATLTDITGRTGLATAQLVATITDDSDTLELPAITAQHLGTVEIGETVRGSYVVTETGAVQWDMDTAAQVYGVALVAV